MTRPRVALVASHPIQYQVPWFRALSRAVDLHVYFCHRQDARGQAAAGYGAAFEWDVPLLDGYRFEWLRNVARVPSVFEYRGCDTPGIAQLVTRGRFDACIVSGWYLKSYVQTIRACSTAGVPLMVRGDSHLGTPRSLLKTAIKWLPYRVLLGSARAHLYVGQANKAYLRHYGVPEGRLFFAPHFVDNGFFAERSEQARRSGAATAVRAGYGIDPGATVVLFVGRLVDMKRPQDFVAAVALASRDHAPVHGIVVGSGPLLGRLQSLAAELGAPVHFAGFRNQTELPVFYAASDAIVLPSDGRETWGLVVNEAMACGLPAIVSDAVGCAPDLIDEGETGYAFPMGDPRALGERLVRLRADLAARRESLREAVGHRIASYACPVAVDGTLAALADVTGRNRAS